MPRQLKAAVSRTGVQEGHGEFTEIRLNVRDAIRQEDQWITLRARRWSFCGKWSLPVSRGMQDTRACGASQETHGQLTVHFDPADNPDLAPGLYRGRLWIQATHGESASEFLQVNVKLDMPAIDAGPPEWH